MLCTNISNKASTSLLTTSVQHCAGSHNKYNKKRKGSKHYTDYKEGIKQTVLFVCLKSHSELTKKKKKILELSDYSKVIGHKANGQKSITVLYTSNK